MSDPAASKRAREEGNALFRRGRWADAASAYSRAIAADETDALPRANRAMAWLKLERYADAAADATGALAIDAAHVKARYRRALARRGMGELEGAAEDLRGVLAREENDAAREELGEVEAEIKAKAGREEAVAKAEAKDKDEAEAVARAEAVAGAEAKDKAEAVAKAEDAREATVPSAPPAAPTSFAALRGKRDARPAYARTQVAPGLTAVSTKSTSTPTTAPSLPPAATPSTPAPAPPAPTTPSPAAPAPSPTFKAPIPPNPTSTARGAGLALLRALKPLSPAHRRSYLGHYPASVVPRILAPIMEPEAVGMLLTALDAGAGEQADAGWTRELMSGLRRTPRWAVNAAMLSASERAAGERAWAASGGEGPYL